PGEARSELNARKPTPRRLRVFCSTAAIILLHPITTLAPRTAKLVSSVRRWREPGFMIDHWIACDSKSENGRRSLTFAGEFRSSPRYAAIARASATYQFSAQP